MELPKFVHIDKGATDLLDGFFDTGRLSVSLKSCDKGNEFLFTSRTDQINRVSFGSKVDFASKYGLNMQQKWNTDNVVFTELAFNNLMVSGSRLGVTAGLMPTTGRMSGALNGLIRREHVRLESSLVHEEDKQKVHSEAVVRVKNMLVGGCWTFSEGSVVDRLLALAYLDDNFTFAVKTKDFKDMSLSMFQRMTGSVQSAIRLTYSKETTQMEMGCQYETGRYTLLAKANTDSTVAIAASRQLGSGFTAKAWTSLDGKTKQPLLDRFTFGVGFQVEI